MFATLARADDVQNTVYKNAPQKISKQNSTPSDVSPSVRSDHRREVIYSVREFVVIILMISFKFQVHVSDVENSAAIDINYLI